MPPQTSSDRIHIRRQSLLMGGLCAVVGLLTGLGLWRLGSGNNFSFLAVSAPLAGFCSGATIWWFLLRRQSKPGAVKGAIAGAIAAILAHWLCWYLSMVAGYNYFLFDPTFVGSLGEAPMNPIQALAGATTYTAISLVIVGWLTVPAGALIGAVLGSSNRSDPR